MDLATLLGVVAGFSVIVWACSMGEAKWVDVPSIMIVFGGMIASTLIHFSMGQVLRIFSVIKKTVFYVLPSEQALIQKMVNCSAINRRDGALALEQQAAEAGDSFLEKGLRMVIDGLKEPDIEKQLGTEIQYLQERHSEGKKILEFLASAAPAFGMIGTLIGLVQMLGAMENPEDIGAGMAVALITTFYGALLANLVFLPLAGKLGIRSKRETLLKEMIMEGVLNISRGEGPTVVRERMQAFVAARHRQEFKPSI